MFLLFVKILGEALSGDKLHQTSDRPGFCYQAALHQMKNAVDRIGQQKRPSTKLQKRCCFIWNLSGIISIFVEQFRTPDPTLCGGFAAQPWPPTDHGGSAHGWRDLFALHDGVRSPQAQDGTTAAMPPTPSSAKPLRSH